MPAAGIVPADHGDDLHDEPKEVRRRERGRGREEIDRSEEAEEELGSPPDHVAALSLATVPGAIRTFARDPTEPIIIVRFRHDRAGDSLTTRVGADGLEHADDPPALLTLAARIRVIAPHGGRVARDLVLLQVRIPRRQNALDPGERRLAG